MAAPLPLYSGPTPLDTPDIPDVLKAYRQWVLWRGVEKITEKGTIKLDKVPINAQTLQQASTTDPSTWHTFDACVAALETALEEWEHDAPQRYRGGGIGFVFTAEDPFVGIDLDHCFDPTTGTIATWAQGYVTQLNSYTEITPSGTGLHTLVEGTLPSQGRKKGPIEMYDAGRFFTVTGWILQGYTLTIEPRQDALSAMHAQVFDTPSSGPGADRRTHTGRQSSLSPGMTDTDILTRVSQAKHGEKFAALHTGDISAYPSPSEADFAYCVRLAFWTQDPDQIDRLYRDSQLMRKKWDSKRGDSTYGAWTIANALACTTEHYTPSPGYAGWGSRNGDAPGTATPQVTSDWRSRLLTRKKGEEVIQDMRNISLLLENADPWRGKLWWDEVRCKPMYQGQPVDDDLLVTFAIWLGDEKLSLTSFRMLERCMLAQCRTDRRDLIQHWLNALPPWDQIPRLTTWLHEIAGVETSIYSQEVSRLLITSMVARGLDPGCICRYVVILEGPEEFRKSSLVEALATPEWYVVLSIGLDSKDSHMMLQGCWVAEMAELDSLSKTEETRLKAFITMRQDSYVPKYSNFRDSHARRAIFVGTTNEEAYLKGQSGNTRYLPIRITKPVDVEAFQAMRDQLFAEALFTCRSNTQWWAMAEGSTEEAKEARELRRVENVYEAPLREWLTITRHALNPPIKDDQGHLVTFLPRETSWPELARYFLRLDTPEKWKDRSLQMQIGQALKAIGWHRAQVWRTGGKAIVWQQDDEVGRNDEGR
ncbi:MAG TPA: VapE domain-containing protein [Nitrospiraceae bacterium]